MLERINFTDLPPRRSLAKRNYDVFKMQFATASSKNKKHKTRLFSGFYAFTLFNNLRASCILAFKTISLNCSFETPVGLSVISKWSSSAVDCAAVGI